MSHSLTRFRTPRVATVLLALIGGVILAWIGVALQRPEGVFSQDGPDLVFVLQIGLPFPIAGWVIARRAPDNPLGWVFLVGPLLMTMSLLSVDVHGLVDTEALASRRALAATWYLGDAVFFAGVGLVATQFLIRFPTGRAPSTRWHRVAVGGAIGMVITVVWSLARPCVAAPLADTSADTVVPACSELGGTPFLRIDNPFGLDRLPGGLVDLMGAIGLGMVVLTLLLGAVSLFVRYRSAGQVERAQLRWLLAAVAVLAPVFTGIAVVESVTGRPLEGPLGQIVVGSALMALPVAIVIAITRYRLYDIDRIISRSVTYVVVVAVSAAAFAFLALVPMTVVVGLGSGGETPAWLVAVSTLAVAAGFSPLRRRVQGLVDRRFDRARYDAGRVAEQFAERVRDETELPRITADLGGVAGEIFRPRSLGLWMRP